MHIIIILALVVFTLVVLASINSLCDLARDMTPNKAPYKLPDDVKRILNRRY